MKRNDFLKASTALGAALLTYPRLSLGNIMGPSSELSAKILRTNEEKRINVLGDNMTIKLSGKETKTLGKSVGSSRVHTHTLSN